MGFAADFLVRQLAVASRGHRREGDRRALGSLFLLALTGLVIGTLPCRVKAQSVTVTNVFQNHYHYGYPIGNQDCPSGYNIPAGQYSSTYHLERGHAIHHLDPKNPANDYWVYWAHFDNSSYGVAEVAVFKSTTECGPYILQTGLYPAYNTDGASYGFQPGGWQSRDEIVFRDTTTQTYNPDGSVASYASAYLISASNDLGTQTSSTGSTCNYANDSMAIFRLTPDYLGIDASTNTSTNGANWAFGCDQREAPVMFRQGSKYFLITSQAAGWYPSQGGYGVSANPLTGWTPDPLNLGNTSTFGGQTSDGFTIEGTEANTYVLTFDHLGGDDSKNPAKNELTDTGEMWLPVLLDDTAGTATLNWYPSWTVDNTTGVLTLPTMTNLAVGSSATATVTSVSGYPASNAVDGSYTTRWVGSSTGSSSFNAAKPTTSTLCPITGATSSTTCSPSLITDLGSVQPVQELDLSWYMVKGSEPYYTFKVEYSNDGQTWNTLDYTAFANASNAAANNLSAQPFSNDITYGFNAVPVSFSARYVAVTETSVVQQNSTSPFYGPGLYELGVIGSTAPAVPEPVTLTVTPSSSSPATDSSFTVGVTVAGPAGQPTPSGYVQLSAPNYVSETYGLVQGASSFTVPAGALGGGAETITVSYRPDPTSVPIYGTTVVTGGANVSVSAPDAPTSLSVTASAPASLTAAWSASIGASSYIVERSSDGGDTYTQVGTTSATTFTDTGLTNGGSYCYAVAAENGAGAGPLSSAVCATPTTNFPVSNLSVTPSGPGALTISFTGYSTATGYLIKRSVAGGAYSTLTTTTATSYTDSGLTDTTDPYCYTVAAVFSSGTAGDSAPVCNTVSDAYVPANVAVTQWASGALYLSWLTSGATNSSYVIKRSVNGGPYVTIATQTALTYIDTGLTNYSNVYCYVVDSYLNGVSGPDSASACSSPTGDFLGVPNSSFETPSEKSALWQTGTSISGGSWTFVGGSGASSGNVSGISYNNTGTWTNGNGNAPDGVQVAYLCGTGSIAQAISGFVVGQTYTITVAASERQNKTQTANPFTISVNGSVIATFNPSQSVAYYRDYSVSFTATAATNTIAIAGTTTTASTVSTVLIDNVRIATTGTAASTISVSPMTIAQGTASAVLTATQTFSGAAPAGGLIFQVNGGSQVAGTCTVNGSTQTCTANYPTAKLAVGAATIVASYLGDTNYAAASGENTLTVNEASTGTVQLTTTTVLAQLADGSYTATVSVENNGTTTAGNVTITSLALGSAAGAPVPASLGNIAPGGTATVTLSAPASAGTAGSTVVERVNGTYSGGTFGGSLRARLP